MKKKLTNNAFLQDLYDQLKYDAEKGDINGGLAAFFLEELFFQYKNSKSKEDRLVLRLITLCDRLLNPKVGPREINDRQALLAMAELIVNSKANNPYQAAGMVVDRMDGISNRRKTNVRIRLYRKFRENKDRYLDLVKMVKDMSADL